MVAGGVLPTLGRFGARPDDPYLLNRPYLTSWLGFVAATVLVTALLTWARRHARRVSATRRRT